MQNIFKMEEIMHNQLTESDIKKMQEEIEYRKLVVRKEALEDVKEARAQATFRRISNIMLQKNSRTKMKAGFVSWSG